MAAANRSGGQVVPIVRKRTVPGFHRTLLSFYEGLYVNRVLNNFSTFSSGAIEIMRVTVRPKTLYERREVAELGAFLHFSNRALCANRRNRICPFITDGPLGFVPF
jgi:hypothetical protein